MSIFAVLAFMVIGSSAAHAAPYPPPNPCATASGGSSLAVGGAGESRQDCRSFAPSTDVRTTDTTSRTPSTDATASTGFDALTASLIAAVLLVGGGALVFAGRRAGKHS